jgi:membrane-bound ClpP family serine protease
MWVVAGILLAIVVLGILAGFHFGPHAHVPAAIAGVLAAAWLISMALLGDAKPLLYMLLGADVAITGLLGVGAVKVLRHPEAYADRDKPPHSEDGKYGVAETVIDPEGIVQLGGEQWSARSMNGRIEAGAAVQVIRTVGLRLEVWAENGPTLEPPQAAAGLFQLQDEPVANKEASQ